MVVKYKSLKCREESEAQVKDLIKGAGTNSVLSSKGGSQIYNVDAGKRKPLPSRKLRQTQIRYGYKLIGPFLFRNLLV